MHAQIRPHLGVAAADMGTDDQIAFEQLGQIFHIPQRRFFWLQGKMHCRQRFPGQGHQPIFGHQFDHRVLKWMVEGARVDEGIGAEFCVLFPTQAERAQIPAVMFRIRGRRRRVQAPAQFGQMLGRLILRQLAGQNGDVGAAHGRRHGLERSGMDLQQ